MSEKAKWTSKEINLLKANINAPVCKLMELFPNRTRGAINNKRLAVGGNPRRGAKPWSPEEDELIRSSGDMSLSEVREKLLPHRTLGGIRLRRVSLGVICKREEIDHNYTDISVKQRRRRRPLTDETAYQVRIEYADKRRIGYTDEEAVEWCAEANDRDADIIRDVLTNHLYDAQVEACKRKYSSKADGWLNDYDEQELEVIMQCRTL